MAYKVVLLGGSFDPIHDGHLAIMQAALKFTQAQEGWFVLAKQANLKKRKMSSYQHRTSMIAKQIASYPKLSLCTVEKNLPIPNYTINTIMALQKQYPTYQFYFLIGGDQYQQLTQWYQYEQLVQKVQFIVVSREGYQLAGCPFPVIDSVSLDISSSDIRKGLSFATSPAVLAYMAQYGLYFAELSPSFLSSQRIKHCYRVAQVAKELAFYHRLDGDLLYGLGLWHDLFKEKSPLELSVWISPFEKSLYPSYFWHGVAIANYLSRCYYVKDRDYLKALKGHGDGRFNQVIANILYISDKCEPQRQHQSDYFLKLAQLDTMAAKLRLRKYLEGVYGKS